MLEPTSTRPTRARAATFAICVAALVFVMALQPVRAADFWHHLKSGQWAWLRGPAATEPFSFSAAGQPWIQFEWLAQLLMFLGFSAGSVNFLIVVKAALGALAFLLLWLACRRGGGSSRTAALAAVAAACAFAPRSFVRPEMFSLPLLALCVYAIEQARAGRGRWLWALPPVFALWPNLHGLYVAGLLLLGLAVAGDRIEAALFRFSRGRLCRRQAGRVAMRAAWPWYAALLASFLATLCNPYGLWIWQVPFRLATTPVFAERIGEWQASSAAMLAEPTYWPLLLLIVLTLATLRRLRPADVLRLAVFAAMAVSARRHVPLLAFVCAPIFARQAGSILMSLRGIRTREAGTVDDAIPSASPGAEHAGDVGGESNEIAASSRPRAGLLAMTPNGGVSPLANAALAALLLTMTWGALGWPRFDRLGLGFKPGVYPARVAAFLRAEKLTGNLFNTYRYGNYFLWTLAGNNRVFIDGRIDMYGGALLQQYEDVLMARPGWRQTLSRYDVNIVVLAVEPEKKPRPLARALLREPDWRLVYWDDMAVLFLRDAPTPRPAIARLGTFTFLPDDFGIEALKTPAERRRIIAELERQVARRPLCFRAQYLLAVCYEAAGDYARAATHYAVVLGGDPQSGAAWYNLGAVQARLGRVDAAETLLLGALDLGAPRAETLRTLGAVYFVAGRYAEAIGRFRLALAAAPNDWRTYANLAMAYDKTGDRAAMRRALEKVVELNPADEAARRRLDAMEKGSPQR